MADTQISYKGQGFWISEIFVEILCQFICQAFESIGFGVFSRDLIDIYDDCNVIRKGMHGGMVVILFDDSLQTSSDLSAMINVLQQTKPIILNYGDELTVDYLNQFENVKDKNSRRSYWKTPIKTKSLIDTMDLLVQTLNGTLNSDTLGVYYVGFPHPNTVIPL